MPSIWDWLASTASPAAGGPVSPQLADPTAMMPLTPPPQAAPQFAPPTQPVPPPPQQAPWLTALTQGLAADPTLGQTLPGGPGGVGAYAGHALQSLYNTLMIGPQLTKDVAERGYAGDPMSIAEIAPRSLDVASTYTGLSSPFAMRGALGSAGGRAMLPEATHLAPGVAETPGAARLSVRIPANEAAAETAPALLPGEYGRGEPSGAGSLAQAQREAKTAAGSAQEVAGLPKGPFVGANGEPYVPGPIEDIHKAAEDYARNAGIDYKPVTDYAKVDKQRASNIAQEYADMPHAPDDPKVQAAYDAMINETKAQYQTLKDRGYTFEFMKPGQPDPYAASPRLAAQDFRDNKHLWVYPTDIGYGSGNNPELLRNPMLQPSGEIVNGHPALNNDLFRIVHDVFGHFQHGFGFRAEGEENAWRSHSRMYSDVARPAMTAETRGQNSWVNYGPYGDANRTASAADTIYAPQKVGVMPDWTVREGAEDAPSAASNLIGKPFKQFTPQDWGTYGQQYGVPNLGPSSNEAFEKSLVPIKTESGRTVTIPGGIEDQTKPFSYYDLLHLKAQGINPNDLAPETHRAIHNRMVSTMQPGSPQALSDPQVFNQLAFGMISPNQALTPNEFALARVMAKGQEGINKIANMVPWKYGDTEYQGKPITTAMRDKASAAIAKEFDLQAGPKGGLGMRGTADYDRIAEMAQMMKDKPEFFRFRGTDEGGASPSENWSRFVSRISSQVPGLSAKTGSLATVWQSPRDAAISAIDRHMAGKLEADIFENPEERAAWSKDTLDKFNADRSADKQVSSIPEMIDQGGKGHYVDQILGYLNNHPDRMLLQGPRKRGAFGPPQLSPNVPPWMGGVDWVRTPQKVTWPSDPYVRALEANQRLAQQNQQGLFANQWMTWDKIRNRLEPHEILFPGLERLPRMDLEQVKDAVAAHTKAGYSMTGGAKMKPVKPVSNPSSLGYFQLPLMIGGAAAAAPYFAQQSRSDIRGANQ